MSRTINGMSVPEVLKKLAEKRNPDKRLMGKYPFYMISSFYERINSVIGVEHYNVEFPDNQKYTVLNNQQELLSCKCRVTLLDDNFEPFIIKEAYGGKEILYEKETGRDGGIKNAPNNCALNAFKEVWKQFGIFGLRPSDENIENTTTTHASSSSEGNEKTNSILELFSKGPLEFVRNDRNTQQPVYRLNCSLKDQEEQRCIIFYPNKYKNCANKIEYIKNNADKGSIRLHVEVTISQQNKDYVFCKFVS